MTGRPVGRPFLFKWIARYFAACSHCRLVKMQASTL